MEKLNKKKFKTVFLIFLSSSLDFSFIFTMRHTFFNVDLEQDTLKLLKINQVQTSGKGRF